MMLSHEACEQSSALTGKVSLACKVQPRGLGLYDSKRCAYYSLVDYRSTCCTEQSLASHQPYTLTVHQQLINLHHFQTYMLIA